MKKSNKVEKIKKKIVKDFKETLDVFSIPVHCIICGREEKCPLSEMPPKKILGLDLSSQYVCEICKQELLNGGVCIMTKDHSEYIVITDESFNGIFGGNIDIPEERIMYVDKVVIEAVLSKFK